MFGQDNISKGTLEIPHKHILHIHWNVQFWYDIENLSTHNLLSFTLARRSCMLLAFERLIFVFLCGINMAKSIWFEGFHYNYKCFQEVAFFYVSQSHIPVV